MSNLKEILEKNYKIVMVAPFFLFLTLLLLYPLLFVIYTTFNQVAMTGQTHWIGMSNYLEMLKDDMFWHSVVITARFSLMVLGISMIVGLALAIVFDSVSFPGKKIVIGLMMIPMLMTPSAIGLLWTQLYNPTFGLLNRILLSLNLSHSLWTSSSHTVLGSLVIVAVWRVTPFIFLVSLAGLSMIPQELYDAARVDGANAFQELVHITLPSLRNLLVIIFIFQMVTVLKIFDEIYIMTYGGPNNASLTTYLYTYRITFEYGRLGYGATLGLILFIVILILSYLSIRARRRLD